MIERIQNLNTDAEKKIEYLVTNIVYTAIE